MTVGEFLDKLLSRIGYVFKSIGDLTAGALDILLGKTAIMDAQIVPFILAVLLFALLVGLLVMLMHLLASLARHIFVWIRKGPSFWLDVIGEEWRLHFSDLHFSNLKKRLVGLVASLAAALVMFGLVMAAIWTLLWALAHIGLLPS